MIGNVVLSQTRREDWPKLRKEIRRRVMESMDTPPAGASGQRVRFEELKRCQKHGLTHVHLRYHVLGEDWTEAICVLPPGCDAKHPAPGVLAIHGTNYEVGKFGVLDPEKSPKSAYGIELARRGYVTMAVDQFGFGSTIKRREDQPVLFRKFFKQHPGWSIDGRHLLDHQRALDVMEKLDFVAGDGFGAVGNSLGGRGVMYIAALDRRVAAAVSSCGISPNASNVFRSCTYQKFLSPPMAEAIMADGKIPWEYSEMIALCAPRALLAIEPYNDNSNPDVGPTMQCFYRAGDVYRLLGCPEKLTLVVHGEGHGTPADLRAFAYLWLDRFLKDRKDGEVGA